MWRLVPAAGLLGVSAMLAGSASGPATAADLGGHQGPAVQQAVVPVVRPVLLIDGDRLAVRSDRGRPEIAIRAAARLDAVTGLRFGGQVLEIPTLAMPYVGRGLSPSLSELGALEKAGAGCRSGSRSRGTGRRCPAYRSPGWHRASPRAT